MLLFRTMDIERPIFVKADSSEWPNKFICGANGTSEDAAGEYCGDRGIGRWLDRNYHVERIHPGVESGDGGIILIQFFFFIWTIRFHCTS